MKQVFTLERAFNLDTSVVCKPRSLCLVTVSVSMRTGQLGLRIQGLPLPGDHLKLTRHVSYIC